MNTPTTEIYTPSLHDALPISENDVNGEAVARRHDLYSSVASTSAGGELKNCEVLLFGNSPAATGDLRIGHGILKDAIDADGRSEEHTSELQSPDHLVCRLLLE